MQRSELLSQIANLLVELDLEGSKAAVEKAVEANIPPYEIITKGVARGLEIVGEKFEASEYFLSELVMAGYVANTCMEMLEPLLKGVRGKRSGRVVIGTVKGDLHDIGKNVVIAMLVGSGLEVYDLGVDVPASKFVEKVREVNADVFGMSALLTITMPYMKTVIDELKRAGLRDKVKVIIGGRPVTAKFARAIGADAYAKDALEGLRKVKELMKSL
jgi:5-methyltetrahydrofolate--homocysteine methyltransferase